MDTGSTGNATEASAAEVTRRAEIVAVTHTDSGGWCAGCLPWGQLVPAPCTRAQWAQSILDQTRRAAAV